jgi:5-hydroxyisourate hydrolase-like protein (transthyretin family)
MVGILTLVLVVASGALAPRAVQAQGTNVVPPVGEPGTEFAFSAEGFEPNRRVAFWVNLPDGSIDANDALYAVSANDDGRADWTWTAPDDAQIGFYEMVAQGQEGTVRTTTFEVTTGVVPGEAPPTAADTGVTPDVGPPGTEFAFFANGFRPERRVAFWVNYPDGSIDANEALYAVSANDDGRADWTWTAPDDAPVGQYEMVARGENRVEQVIPFTVGDTAETPTETAPPDAESSVVPSVGAPGTEFAFFAEDFEPNRRVAFWVNLPDGSIDADEALYAVSANRDGRADWTWTAPDDAQPGRYEMVARGQEGTQHVIPFEVR